MLALLGTCFYEPLLQDIYSNSWDCQHPVRVGQRILPFAGGCSVVQYGVTLSAFNFSILTINFRTILDRLAALRRYLLDLEIPGRRLEIVCTFRKSALF